jgi:multiple sugar transport system permease protein
MRWPRGRLIVLILLSVLFVAPFLWMVSSSVKPEGEAVRSPFSLSSEPAFTNYRDSLNKMGAFHEESPAIGFGRLAVNTIFVTTFSIVFQLFTCSLAGYGFARMRFRGKRALFPLVLATMMLPVQVTVIPQFVMFQSFGWIDTYFPLLVPALLGGNPFFIFLFRQYFLTIPRDVLESARIDGCGWWSIYWRIMLPLARPVMATVAILTLLWTWNDLWTPLIYINSPEKATLTLALAGFSRTYRIDVEQLMAASTMVVLPCIILYFMAQKYFMRGIQLSASKG